jgi:hypothetical protein
MSNMEFSRLKTIPELTPEKSSSPISNIVRQWAMSIIALVWYSIMKTGVGTTPKRRDNWQGPLDGRLILYHVRSGRDRSANCYTEICTTFLSLTEISRLVYVRLALYLHWNGLDEGLNILVQCSFRVCKSFQFHFDVAVFCLMIKRDMVPCILLLPNYCSIRCSHYFIVNWKSWQLRA